MKYNTDTLLSPTFGVIMAGPRSSTKNIGDYIQSLAQIQYTGEYYIPIERERISLFQTKNNEGSKIKTIMNAWWMWDPQFWPPSPAIEPLMVSMHISPLAAAKMLSREGIEYFKQHQPIGCRDKGTQIILQEKGISCYFSACLTLTLGRTYRIPDSQRGGVLFCDPYINPITKKNIASLLHCFPNTILHLRSILKLSRLNFFKQYIGTGDLAFEGKFKSRVRGIVNAISFYSTYSSKFDSNCLSNAEYISNLVDVRIPPSNDELLKMAEDRVKKYAKAKLVVTSRIHCALPCIGLNTPTLFVIHDNMNHKGILFNTPGRFEGLTDFFHILTIRGTKIVSADNIINNLGRITNDTTIINKSGWEQYEKDLHRKCTDFSAPTSSK